MLPSGLQVLPNLQTARPGELGTNIGLVKGSYLPDLLRNYTTSSRELHSHIWTNDHLDSLHFLLPMNSLGLNLVYIKGERWHQNYTFYFLTGPLSLELSLTLMLACPKTVLHVLKKLQPSINISGICRSGHCAITASHSFLHDSLKLVSSKTLYWKLPDKNLRAAYAVRKIITCLSS